jgi:pimeloyl-ACP methyl ester carboxylesterase
MKIILFIISLLIANLSFAESEITPYKFTDPEKMPAYTIPLSSRFTVPRIEKNAPDIVYYLTKPKAYNYPIAILVGGSSTANDITSIIHFHRYFLKELTDLGVAVVTLEQWGVDGDKIDKKEYLNHYTRSQRLSDHKTVIDSPNLSHLKGWNGKLIFIGVSEGGPIVASLTTEYAPQAIATISFSGAGDWPWREELWIFIEDMRKQTTFAPKITRQEYDSLMDQTLKEPVANKEFMSMTYKYHADALIYPSPYYKKIITPFLVVSGAKDSTIFSSDAFVEKVRKPNYCVTYLRVPNMDHYVRKRPDIIEQSFIWLKEQLNDK